jgi:hypothetical protein
MFNLDASDTYWWPVKFLRPRQDGEGMETCTFDGLFRRMTTDEIAALQQRIATESLSDTAIAGELLVGWRKVTNSAGEEVPWSSGGSRALREPGCATGVCASWAESLDQGPRKN